MSTADVRFQTAQLALDPTRLSRKPFCTAPCMKLLTRLILVAGLCVGGFGASPTLEAHPLAEALPLSFADITHASATSDKWPGGNRQARKVTRKSRRRTFLKTRGSAVKTMFARKKQSRNYKKASKQGFNKADKSAAPKKKAGCPG